MGSMDEFCVPCGRKMFVAKAGQEVLELTEKGVPYKLMPSDILECPECGHQVATRLGAVKQQYEEGFRESVEAFRAAGNLLEVV